MDPMSDSSAFGTLQARREEILRQLATIGQVRSGSLTPRRVCRGNPKCRCKREGEIAHGPTGTCPAGSQAAPSRAVPSDIVQIVQQIAERKRLRSLTAELGKRQRAGAALRA